jgi:hypothetical protein
VATPAAAAHAQAAVALEARAALALREAEREPDVQSKSHFAVKGSARCAGAARRPGIGRGVPLPASGQFATTSSSQARDPRRHGRSRGMGGTVVLRSRRPADELVVFIAHRDA